MAADNGSRWLKTILIISLSNISTDPRVLRQIETLAPIYKIDVMGFGASVDGIENFYKLTTSKSLRPNLRRKIVKALLLVFRRYKKFYFYDTDLDLNLPFENGARNYDLILANDFSCLPLIKHLFDNETRIFMDAHEYYFDELNSSFKTKIQLTFRKWVIKENSENLVGLVTVSRGIAKLYEADLSIKDVKLVRNIPRQDFSPFQHRSNAGIALIHHGAAIEGRGLVELIRLVGLLDNRFTLNLMLVETDRKFFESLLKMAEPYGDRIRFHSPVPTNNIVRIISQFDLGIHIIPPLSVNHRYALPNKFFEFLQANLGIVVGPSTEMADIVNTHSIGLVSEDFSIDSIARNLNSLHREEVEFYRINSSTASNFFTWKNESSILLEEIESHIIR